MYAVRRQKRVDERRRGRYGVRPEQRQGVHLCAELADVERSDARLDEFPVDDVHTLERWPLDVRGTEGDHDVAGPEIAHGERLARVVNFCRALGDDRTEGIQGIFKDRCRQACDGREFFRGQSSYEALVGDPSSNFLVQRIRYDKYKNNETMTLACLF